jgi:uncharacterized membrane protein AbrB (regulator of aidB expression)
MRPDPFAFVIGVLLAVSGVVVAAGGLDDVSDRPAPWVAGALVLVALAVLVGPLVRGREER